MININDPKSFKSLVDNKYNVKMDTNVSGLSPNWKYDRFGIEKFTPKTPDLLMAKVQPLSNNGLQTREDINTVDPMAKTYKIANIVNGINTIVSGGLAAYSLSQINKMKAPAAVTAPVLEAKKVRDRGAATMANRKGLISQSANTSREGIIRSGRTELLPTITGKEMMAENEAAASIEGLRTNIEQINVNAENRMREINASNNINAQQINSNAQANFQQLQSQMRSGVVNAAVGNISNNLGGIVQNEYSQSMRSYDIKENEDNKKRSLDIQIAESANNPYTYAALISLKKKLYPNQ